MCVTNSKLLLRSILTKTCKIAPSILLIMTNSLVMIAATLNSRQDKFKIWFLAFDGGQYKITPPIFDQVCIEELLNSRCWKGLRKWYQTENRYEMRIQTSKLQLHMCYNNRDMCSLIIDVSNYTPPRFITFPTKINGTM